LECLETVQHTEERRLWSRQNS